MRSIPAEDVVLAEYAQWKLIQELLEKIQQGTEIFARRGHRNQKFKQENLFGRWLVWMQSHSKQQMDERYQLLPRKPIDGEVTGEFIRLLQENFTNMTSDQARELTEEQLSTIDQFITGERKDTGDMEVQYDEPGRIEVGNFRTPSCRRVRVLVEEFGLTNAALASLRYDSLNKFKGGESGMSASFLATLHDTARVTHEGFASPLNCRMLGRQGVKFCSLFEDINAAFGGIGNFFDINLLDHPGGWMLNPPFIEPLLDATARRVVELLEQTERGSFWFFVVFPNWEDNQGWQTLNESEWKAQKMEFSKGCLNFQDCYGARPLTSHTKLNVFVLGDLPDDVDLVQLRMRLIS